MAKMVNIKIIFDRLDRKYSPGDRINLDIHVRVSSDTIFRSIYARMHGFAHVEWHGSREALRGGKSFTAHNTYSSHEIYFKNYKTVAGSHGGTDIRLPAGLHVYHASFTLPQCLPRNHEGGTGYIRYEAKVQMDIPWDFDKKVAVPFFVRSHFDLNKFPVLRKPLRVEAKKKFGFLCWESDSLRVYNILPRRGFVPGERIQYTLELDNDSDVSIAGATVKLIEKIIYHAQGSRSSTREKRRTLWEHTFTTREDQLVAAMQKKVFSTDLFFDPAWGFHFFYGCKIITVEYFIMSEIRMSAYHKNIFTSAPIVIGTIPFGHLGMPPLPLPAITPIVPNLPSSNPISPVQVSAQVTTISEQPLPSYYETVLQPNIPSSATLEFEWAQTNRMESPPPSFNEVEKMEENRNQ